MYRRQATSPNLNLRTPPVLRSRTASMGDVLVHGCTNKKTTGSPSHIPKQVSCRSQSITTNSTQGLINQSHKILQVIRLIQVCALPLAIQAECYYFSLFLLQSLLLSQNGLVQGYETLYGSLPVDVFAVTDIFAPTYWPPIPIFSFSQYLPDNWYCLLSDTNTKGKHKRKEKNMQEILQYIFLSGLFSKARFQVFDIHPNLQKYGMHVPGNT